MKSVGYCVFARCMDHTFRTDDFQSLLSILFFKI